MTSDSQSDDFDVAKAVFDQLKDLAPERQQRVLRWIAEGLGVAPVVSTPVLAIGGIPPQHNAPVGGAGASTDIKSFIAMKSPKSDNQFAASVAYFYRFEVPPAARRESITGELLQEAARLSGRKRLSEPRKTLNNAKAAGYLDGAARGEYSINSVGENLVAMTLPSAGEALPKRRKTARQRKSGKKAKSTSKKC
jgi:hypothetical protein